MSSVIDWTWLYRPVGKKELELIRVSGFKRFPARLPHQSIFYPVSNEQYAEQIARRWNTKDSMSGYEGHVTKFKIRNEFLKKYTLKTVGLQAIHNEYWIPSEDLEELNDNIIGLIEVVSSWQKSS